MFYSTEVLRNRRSNLGVIWSAAWGRKLARSSVLNVNIDQTCDQLMDPEVPQALRLQAILASGIVKLHEKKVHYLQEDAEHAMRRLCDVDSNGKRSIDLDEKRSRKKRITIIDDQLEGRQAIDLFFGSSRLESHNDFDFGESYGCKGLEEELFLPRSGDAEFVSLFANEEGFDQRNYIMESPADAPFFQNQFISDPVHFHTIKESPTSVFDQGTIIVKPKRKRAPKVDQGIEESFCVDQPARECVDHLRDTRVDKNASRIFASFSASDFHIQTSLYDCLKKVHITRNSMRNKDPKKSTASFHHSEWNFDNIDPRVPIEQRVEIEKLRNILSLTPNENNRHTNKSKSLPSSPGDFSQEESGYLSNRSSVQKERLSGLFHDSRYDLDDDVFIRKYSSSEENHYSNVDDFKLKESGSSQSLLGSIERFQDWDQSSHTIEILTKARLCSKRWGAASILLLEDLTSHLTRHEAAAMFHHILVGYSSGLIKAYQNQAYGPITIEFVS